MEMRYPIVIIIGIVFIVLIFFLKEKNKKYKSGIKIANTSFIKETPYYKNKLKKYKCIVLVYELFCVVAMLASIFLVSRPVKVKTTNIEEYNRDIMLCMDVSASVNELNSQIIDNLKKTVMLLKGERFGISIFNSTTVMLSPLTDDYDYVISVLDQMEKSLALLQDSSSLGLDNYYDWGYLIYGTQEGQGSSLIGDGLASCIYSFDENDKDRTKIIVFSTDNSLAGTPIVTLEEAAKIARKNNIIVYGIAPDLIKPKDEKDFQNAMQITKGKYYNEDSTTVKNIVNEIENTSRSLLKKENQIQRIDNPQIIFIVLTVSLIGSIILKKVILC